jgi:ABC-type glycerol-3-phosphate transport system substrate-binding protein
MRRKSAACVLLACGVFAIVLAGCVRKGPGPADAKGAAASSARAPGSQRKVRLSVLAGQSTPDPGIEEMINDLLERELPGVELEWEKVGWGDKFQSQMRAKFASGEVPDIMIGKAQDVATYLPSGNLAPIPSSLLGFVRNDALDSLSSGGAVYGIPYNAFYQGVLYNKDIFERFGLSPPKTRAELDAIVKVLRAKGVTPFAAQFGESWYAGNVVMQLAMGSVFNDVPDWGDAFRAGRVSFSSSAGFRDCMIALRGIREESWPDAFAIGAPECDERFAAGKAAMYVSGSWTLQTVKVVNPGMRLGIFPYPNSTGDAKLIFEPNMTFMKSSKTSRPEEVDEVLAALFGSKDLASEIFDFTQTSSLLKDAGSEVPLPIQADVERYRRGGRIVDVTLGNTQLIWSFQEEVARRLGDWLQGKSSLAEVLKFADANRELSGPR